MDYTKASDLEINRAVCEKYLGLSIDKDIQRMFVGGRFDYCNDWSAMGPIIEREKISITFRSRGEKDLAPQAKRFASDDHNIADKNPLRAAAIVYLMMGV